MIDVSPYIQKLEILREYMAMRIAGPNKICINMNAIPPFSPDELLKLFSETGILFIDATDYEPVPELSFHEWLESKNKIQ